MPAGLYDGFQTLDPSHCGLDEYTLHASKAMEHHSFSFEIMDKEPISQWRQPDTAC